MNDIFSQIIIDAVDKVKTAVVKIERIGEHAGKEQVNGSGSGFIFSSDGYLFTNSHVVAGAQKLNVMLYGGNSHPATLICVERFKELSTFKIFANQYMSAVFCGSFHVLIWVLRSFSVV